MTAGRVSPILGRDRHRRRSNGSAARSATMTERRMTLLDVDEQIGRINREASRLVQLLPHRDGQHGVPHDRRPRPASGASMVVREVQGPRSGNDTIPGPPPVRGPEAVSTPTNIAPMVSVSERVIRLVRKLDAGNPPVQFDERGVETERHATAPLLDSTLVFSLRLGSRLV